MLIVVAPHLAFFIMYHLFNYRVTGNWNVRIYATANQSIEFKNIVGFIFSFVAFHNLHELKIITVFDLIVAGDTM